MNAKSKRVAYSVLALGLVLSLSGCHRHFFGYHGHYYHGHGHHGHYRHY